MLFAAKPVHRERKSVKMWIEDALMSNEHYTYYPLEYFLQQQAALGAKRLELYLAPPHVWVDWQSEEDLSTLRAKIEAAGLRVDAVRPETISQRYAPFAAEPERARRSRLYYRRCANIARALGAPLMTLAPVGVYRDEPTGQGFGRAVRQICEICRDIAPTGVTLALENVAPNAPPLLGCARDMCRLLDEAAQPNLACALDVVGMSEAGESLPEWFALLGGRIAYVRLSDGRKGMEHMVCGQGLYPMRKYLAQLNELGYRGPVALPLGKGYSADPAAADRRNRAALAGLLSGEVAL